MALEVSGNLDEGLTVEIPVKFYTGVFDNSKIKYIVKPEDGVVVGIFEGNNRDDVWMRIASQVSINYLFALEELVDDEYNKDFTIKAIAKCAKGDTFDEEYGKKLVEAKIYRKLHAYIIKRYNNAIKSMEKLSMRIQNERIRHEWKVSRIDDDLKNYFGVEPPND